MTQDDEVFDQVAVYLASRRGWRFEPPTTPGAPPSWCLESDGDFLIALSVIDGNFSIYLPATDRELNFTTMEALVDWLEANEGQILGN